MVTALNPHVSVDCVVFGFDELSLKVLVIDRNYGLEINEQSAAHTLKLPGSLVYDDEDVDTAAVRILNELTGLENIYLKQFHVFGSPDRLNKTEDLKWLQSQSKLTVNRVVTIAYIALIKLPVLQNDPRAMWIDVDNLPELAFDHREIIMSGVNYLRKEINHEPIVYELLPKKFTLRQLQTLYEIILGQKLDSRNFRKKLAKLGYLEAIAEKEKNVAHKPAQFYKYDRKKYLQLRKTG